MNRAALESIVRDEIDRKLNDELLENVLSITIEELEKGRLYFYNIRPFTKQLYELFETQGSDFNGN